MASVLFVVGRFVCSLGFDLFTRLEFLDFRHLDLNEYNRSHPCNVALKDLEEEMHVIFRGKAYRGFYGYRRIASALPVFWPLAPWLFLPGISSLGALVYGYVARHRRQVLWCDAHCPVQPAEAGEAAKVTMTGDIRRGFGYVVAVSGIIVVALLCWFNRIEFYPFTSWHLYSGSKLGGKRRVPEGICAARVWRKLPCASRRYYRRDRSGQPLHPIPSTGAFRQRPERCRDLQKVPTCCRIRLQQEGSTWREGDAIRDPGLDTGISVRIPSTPIMGRLTDRFAFEINTGRTLREKNLRRSLAHRLRATIGA